MLYPIDSWQWFFLTLGFMLTWLIVSLYIQKTLSFVRFQLLIVNLNFWANWVLLRKSFPTPASCQVLNTNIKHPEKDIMDTLWHTVTSQKMKYLIMNLTMEVKLLYNTNFKSVTLGKMLRNWNMPHAHGLVGWVNILKMTILPKDIYRFSEITIRHLISLFTKIENNI